MNKAINIVVQMWLDEANKLNEMIENGEETFKICLQLSRSRMCEEIYNELRKVEMYGKGSEISIER